MRKRSVVRGVLAAIVSHYVVLFGLLFLFWLLRPFVWAAIYGVPFQPVKGPMDPNSGEWLVSQAIGFLSWVAGGYAACRWDKLGSNRSVLAIGLIYLAMMAMGSAPETSDLIRKGIFYLEIPPALGAGWLLCRRSEPRCAVLIGIKVCE
jgi:hypothetical protein